MPKLSSIAKFARMIDDLKAERAKAMGRVQEIDAIFGQLGIGTPAAAPVAAPAPARRGRPVGSKSAAPRGGRRKRGTFATTGEQSVLGYIKSHDRASAAEVNQHWRGEGRGGKADNTLTKLVKDGQLKRIEVKGERGGRYSIA